MTQTEPDVLTVPQRQRVAALVAAKDVLSTRTAAGPFAQSGVDLPEYALITIAEFIVGENQPLATWPGADSDEGLEHA
jgi:hypothetical protein